jgi:hypothetical protein
MLEGNRAFLVGGIPLTPGLASLERLRRHAGGKSSVPGGIPPTTPGLAFFERMFFSRSSFNQRRQEGMKAYERVQGASTITYPQVLRTRMFSQGSDGALPVTVRRAKRENGGLGKDPPGSTMTY